MNDKKKNSRLERLRAKMTVLSRLSSLDQSDVLGSYTGTDAKGEAPVQDQDDL